MFDRKRIIIIVKFLITLLTLILILMLICRTLAKYETTATTDANIQAAFYLLKDDYQTMTVNLAEMQPRDETYSYTFSVANNDGTKRTETSLEYDLQMRATTNLPLRYKLYLNGIEINIITNSETIIDEYGTYFRVFSTDTKMFGHTENETNIYNLVIEFPLEYKQTIEYQDVIEGIEITVNSRQMINEGA